LCQAPWPLQGIIDFEILLHPSIAAFVKCH